MRYSILLTSLIICTSWCMDHPSSSTIKSCYPGVFGIGNDDELLLMQMLEEIDYKATLGFSLKTPEEEELAKLIRQETPDSYTKSEDLSEKKYILEEDTSSPHVHWYTASSRAFRPMQQDATGFFNTTDDCPYAGACIADGHGPAGHFIASQVTRYLPKKACECLHDVGYDNELKLQASLKDAFVSVDQMLLKKDLATGKLIHPESTKITEISGAAAVLALMNIKSKQLLLAHAGDCRALHYDFDDQQVVWLTTDHRVDLPDEATRIKACGGAITKADDDPYYRISTSKTDEPGICCTLNMSRAFGDTLLKQHGLIVDPTTNVCHLSDAKQLLILMSDGIHDAPQSLSLDAIGISLAKLAIKGLDTPNPAAFLVENRPFFHADNATAIIGVINPKN